MSRRSSKGRTQAFTRVQSRQRLEYARRCHEAGELVGSDDSDSYAAKVAVSLYVLAGIAASDAICGAAIGERWRGDNHRGAVSLLREAIIDQAPGKSLDTLLDLKDAAHYSTAIIDVAAEKRAGRASALLVAKARELLA